MSLIYSFEICEIVSLIRHLGLAIGNVRCVCWFSWTLEWQSYFQPLKLELLWETDSLEKNTRASGFAGYAAKYVSASSVSFFISDEYWQCTLLTDRCISVSLCIQYVPPLVILWSYLFLAQTHWWNIQITCITSKFSPIDAFCSCADCFSYMVSAWLPLFIIDILKHWHNLFVIHMHLHIIQWN